MTDGRYRADVVGSLLWPAELHEARARNRIHPEREGAAAALTVAGAVAR
jgi:hypothetical protein